MIQLKLPVFPVYKTRGFIRKMVFVDIDKFGTKLKTMVLYSGNRVSEYKTMSLYSGNLCKTKALVKSCDGLVDKLLKSYFTALVVTFLILNFLTFNDFFSLLSSFISCYYQYYHHCCIFSNTMFLKPPVGQKIILTSTLAIITTLR